MLYTQEHTARKTTRDFQKKLIYPLVLRPRSQSNASQQQRSSRQFDAEQHDAQLQQQSLQQRQQLQHQLDLGTASMPCTLIEDAAESQVLPAPYHYPLVRGSFVRRAMSTLPPLRTWNRRLAGGASDGHFHLHLVDDTPSSGGGAKRKQLTLCLCCTALHDAVL